MNYGILQLFVPIINLKVCESVMFIQNETMFAAPTQLYNSPISLLTFVQSLGKSVCTVDVASVNLFFLVCY